MNGSMMTATEFFSAPISRPAMRAFKKHQPQRMQLRRNTIKNTVIIAKNCFSATACREILSIGPAATAGGMTPAA
jgi:hypothetical protein